MNIVKSAFGTEEEYDALSPAGVVNAMFEHTDGEGRLVIPAWPYDFVDHVGCPGDDAGKLMECFMTWDAAGCDAVLNKFDALCAALRELAKEDGEPLFGELLDVWNVYVRGLAESAVANAEVSAVIDAVWDDERPLTAEEQAVYDGYVDAMYSDAESRIGGLAAYDVIVRAQRLWFLMRLKAPESVVNDEAKLLAQALAVNMYGKSTRLLRAGGRTRTEELS
ncbi:MAG: hypothetical protein IKX86_01690 [Clostridia bacterium]|nr:hypothetical protein [Clostridia bacterium]